MTIENRKEISFIKVEATGFQDLCNRIRELEEENQSLKCDNDFLQRQNNACKLRCSKYSLEIQELHSEIADLRFTHKMLTAEEAGAAFARELLGKPMTPEEVAISETESRYDYYTGDDF
jgi:chromosome segregation ATPase